MAPSARTLIVDWRRARAGSRPNSARTRSATCRCADPRADRCADGRQRGVRAVLGVAGRVRARAVGANSIIRPTAASSISRSR
jgi:hypothetical protein